MNTQKWRAAKTWCTSTTCYGPPPSSTSWLFSWVSLLQQCWEASKTWYVTSVRLRQCKLSSSLMFWWLQVHLQKLNITNTLHVFVRHHRQPQRVHLNQRPSLRRSPQSLLLPPLPSTRITTLPPACRRIPPTTCRYREATPAVLHDKHTIWICISVYFIFCI